MKKAFKTDDGMAMMLISKGMRVFAEDVDRKIIYEYVDCKGLKKKDFEGETTSNIQKWSQKLILEEAFPYQKEVKNFWYGVPFVRRGESFSPDKLVEWAKRFDENNNSEMPTIHEFAFFLAQSTYYEGWEFSEIEKTTEYEGWSFPENKNRRYKRFLIVKDYRSPTGFTYVGSTNSICAYSYASDICRSRLSMTCRDDIFTAIKLPVKEEIDNLVVSHLL